MPSNRTNIEVDGRGAARHVVSEAIGEMAVHVIIRHRREAYVRLWIAKILLWLVRFVMGIEQPPKEPTP